MAKKEEAVKTVKENLGCYGPEMKPSEVKAWLMENILDNTTRGNSRISLDVWGAPGCGKTSLVKDLQKQSVEYNGKTYDGFKVVDIPIAQIEEMGDVLGFPEVFVEMEREIEEK